MNIHVLNAIPFFFFLLLFPLHPPAISRLTESKNPNKWKHIKKGFMPIQRRIDINLQTGKTVLCCPVLPLVLHTPKMPVQVSQCPSIQGKDRYPQSCALTGKASPTCHQPVSHIKGSSQLQRDLSLPPQLVCSVQLKHCKVMKKPGWDRCPLNYDNDQC